MALPLMLKNCISLDTNLRVLNQILGDTHQALEMSLESVLQFWFPNEDYQTFWFDGSPDEYIKTHYCQTLADEEIGKFHHLEDNNSILARILLLDQFTRNIYRGCIKEQHKNDEKALQLSIRLLANKRDHQFPICQRIFILFPLRHSRIWGNLKTVLAKINEYTSDVACDSERKLLRLFKNATLRSFTELEDNIYTAVPSGEAFNLMDYEEVIDGICNKYENNKKFTISMSGADKYNIYTTIKNYCINKKLINVCISLSGGVDSMVLLHICKALEIDGFLEKINAVHMEYINREEATLETEMLIEWCGMLKVPLIIRKIDYMQRDEVDRELYEVETRKARFGLYKYMMREYGTQGFCLGHHYGDLGENVLMNLFKGRDILDLFVMEDDSQIEGVRLLRPLLAHSKSDIYQFAHSPEFEIPYFIDSTPDWSCRGVLRRKIMPPLEEQYSQGIYGTLAKVGESSREWGHIIETMVIKPFLQKIIKTDTYSAFEIDEVLLSQPRVFWQHIFLEIFHSAGYKMISNKNLDTSLEMLKRRFGSTEKLHLRFSNGLSAEFHKNILSIKIK
jgi:tRNA(Ile)-lysidine synthetase-like protein